MSRRRAEYDPKPDITVYELACCIGIMFALQGGTSAEDALGDWPSSVTRHFKLRYT